MSPDVRRPLVACLASLVALALLAWLVFDLAAVARLDAKALAHASADREGGLGEWAAAIRHLGDPLPQILLLAGAVTIAVVRDARREALAAVVLVAAANLTTVVLKDVLGAPRFDPLLGYAQVGAHAFPSGHSTAAFAMVAAWVIVVPARWRLTTAVVAFTVAGAVAASVVVLRHHFPSDALAGLLVASAWAFGVLAALRLT